MRPALLALLLTLTPWGSLALSGCASTPDCKNRGPCTSDSDCACGISRATGACDFGPAACIDTSRQCPDFCAGIDGRLRLVCQSGHCVQTR